MPYKCSSSSPCARSQSCARASEPSLCQPPCTALLSQPKSVRRRPNSWNLKQETAAARSLHRVSQHEMPRQALRRALLLVATAAALKPLQRRAALGGLTSAALSQTLPARADELSFSKARNGLEYADAKVGSGSRSEPASALPSTTSCRRLVHDMAQDRRHEGPERAVLVGPRRRHDDLGSRAVHSDFSKNYRVRPTHWYIAHRS